LGLIAAISLAEDLDDGAVDADADACSSASTMPLTSAPSFARLAQHGFNAGSPAVSREAVVIFD
jgi:hypothetical protein